MFDFLITSEHLKYQITGVKGMNYKQFLNIYNQGSEEVYRLFKTYEKGIEALNGQLQVVSKRVSTLEL